jgi:hypothetical protein
MSQCRVITLPDGTTAIVRGREPDWQPSPEDIEVIMRYREDLLAICPGCHCYRHRCACDVRGL